MRYLITGGAGFVGSNLTRTLQEQQPDAELLVVDDMRLGTFANLSSEGPNGWSYHGEIIAGALHELDLPSLIDGFKPNVVFHEASITDTTVMDEAQMIRDNVEPFDELVELCVAQNIRLVWASSAATYGTTANGALNERRPFTLEDAGRPANVYGFSKWVMENIQRKTLAQHPDAHMVGLRYFNVFGPGEQNKGKMASMIYQLAQQMLDGKRPRIFDPGDQARDQIYVKDVVGCTMAGALDGAKSGVYNCGTGEATSFNQIVAALNQAFGTDHAPDYFENPFSFYQDYTCADISQTTAGLNWKPAYTTHDAIVEYAELLKAMRG
ncbi:NAD-dependent epimerase/dehydratase family protein [Algisphaera agarilytica]|uniref:ADP-L-glycero-D-manno-heptose 6-epimerase n=1 Tax=Algisphaera agarilytica TaxID=1385975 RepID=A0A7X0LLR7_9BACT|nr:NAD-dependent epimerase/dehydratase family protein [Algisphaera agarilytica]MBB6430906.1 ADP-L-glycero-D-manno-heptose 6-epimerase [Algisphaera agarilytica]